MNKAGLITKVAESAGLSKPEAEAAVNAVFDCIGEVLSKGERVQLVGFGTFEVKERKAREGRNPRNPDERIEIPALKAPVFKAGKTLKDIVNL